MMKKAFVLIVITIISLTSLVSQTQNFIDQPYIETIATVDTMVTPDEIYLGIVITEKDTKGKVPLEELEEKMKTTLKSIGIDVKENLTLYDLASNFKKFFIKPKDVLKSKAYRLLVTDAVMAGKVMIELEKIEISNIKIEKAEYSKIEEVKLELKRKAVLKAQRQAVIMVKPLKQKVGAAIFISDAKGVPVQNIYDNRVSGEFMIRSIKYNTQTKLPDIQFEKIKVESTVYIKFKLE
jgi:uncharacterized protein